MDVIVSPLLPITPTLQQDVVRMVRHGLADVLEWLGEDTGPKPGEQTHALYVGDKLLVSPTVYESIRRQRVGGSEFLERRRPY